MVRTDTKEPVSVGQRLRRARADLGLRQVEMARAVGVTQSSIAAYETDRRQPPLPVALAFEHVFRISHRWLLHAQGERLVRAGPLRPAILACARERRALEDGTDADRYIAVPCLRDPADAGAETITTEQIEEYCLMRQRVAPHPQRVRCLRIRGDAMAPTLPEGSTVAVDTTPVPLRNLEGRVVCARTPEAPVVVRRLRLRDPYALLFSENPDQQAHPPIIVDLRDRPDPVVGQVTWAWVDLR
ncbi:MAG: helix-turn-helix domain-containing protein [Candidatus Brocadiaceae bacterium]|nr:helix-turn-helix domain-containing protein [Candidatus Brocadiaceae bacterium]